MSEVGAAQGSTDGDASRWSHSNDLSRDDLLAFRSEHMLRSENLAYDIDVWYPRLKKYTYRTHFLPLSLREARAMKAAYQTRYNIQGAQLSEEDVHTLRVLEQRIGDQIQRNFGKRGAFMRLCGRSPKDGEPLDRRAVWDNYMDQLQALVGPGVSIRKSKAAYRAIDGNTKLQAIAQVQWLRVCSGADAMSLLLSSERVYADMIDWIRWGEPEQIVLREWSEAMRMDHEFRAFISNGQVCAISQYDHYTYYPHLNDLKRNVQNAIVGEVDRIHEAVGVPSYVADFHFNQEDDSATLIELSPFLPCTGPALFNWDVDKETMQSGPVELRIKTAAHPQVDMLVESNWDLRWEMAEPRYSTVYQQVDRDQSSRARALKNSKHTLKLMGAALCFAAVALFRYGGADASFAAQRIHSPWTLLASWLFIVVGAGAYTMSSSVRYRPPKVPPLVHTIFVYGTLRDGYHWHSKYLSGAKLVGKATTAQPCALVVGDCGVPYVLADVDAEADGHNIVGEVYQIDHETLKGLDEYEGVAKGYYDRQSIDVTLENGAAKLRAEMYVLLRSAEELRSQPRRQEYDMEAHSGYKAIAHITAKQSRYINADFRAT